MKPTILVVGSLNMDFVVRVDRLPAPGETVLGGEFRMIPGGKGANQAYAAGLLGADSVNVRMAGRVGYDLFADHLKASLAAAGVDVSTVHGTQAQPTGVALIWVDQGGQNSIVVASGANHSLLRQDAENMRGLLRSASCALFQLETPLETVETALSIARQEGVRTILDPAPARTLPTALLRSVDILTPNESEACLLLGIPVRRVTVDEAGGMSRRLLELGPKGVVLKLGEQGCYYCGEEGELHAPGFAVKVVDTTAAGDTFNAALAVALTAGDSIAWALRFANAAAALSVTKMGAQASIPARPDVDAFLTRHEAVA